MRFCPSLVAILMLAGCEPELPIVAAPAVPASCQSQVYGDPAVQAATVQANSSLQQVRVPGVAIQTQAEQQALRRCLSGQGKLPPGGVEAVRVN